MPAIFPSVRLTRCTPCQHAANERDLLAARQNLIREMVKNSGIPAKYQRWDAEKAREVGSNRVLQWILQRQGASMWLGGENGIGKTHATHYAAYQRILQNREPVRAIRCSEFLKDAVHLSMGNYEERRLSRQMVADAANVSLLIIDDIGMENTSADGQISSAKAQILYDIVNGRHIADKRMWITTNLSGAKLRRRLGDEHGRSVLKRLTNMIPKDNILKGQEDNDSKTRRCQRTRPRVSADLRGSPVGSGRR